MENRASHEGPTVPMDGPPAKASLFEDFIDIFYQPGVVFSRHVKSGFWLHLVVVAVIAAAFLFANRGLMGQIMEGEFARATAQAVAENPQAAEQIQAMAATQAKIGMIFAYLSTPIIVFFTALFVWLVGMMAKAKVSYEQAAMIVTLAFVPRLIGSLAMTLQALLTDTSAVTSAAAVMLSPARFLDPEAASPKLVAGLMNLEVFALWSAVLIGIGVATMARVPRAKGYVVSGIVFVVLSLPALLR